MQPPSSPPAPGSVPPDLSVSEGLRAREGWDLREPLPRAGSRSAGSSGLHFPSGAKRSWGVRGSVLADTDPPRPSAARRAPRGGEPVPGGAGEPGVGGGLGWGWRG